MDVYVSLVLYPPVVGTIVALRFNGNFLWISLDLLLDLYMSVVVVALILMMLFFPVVIWATHKKNFLPVFIVIASIIYSLCICMAYANYIT